MAETVRIPDGEDFAGDGAAGDHPYFFRGGTFPFGVCWSNFRFEVIHEEILP
jgi:hypothetical protein